jgi:hypothetical protein
MSFSVDVRGIDELIDGDDDPLREIVIGVYGHRPLSGSRSRETFYQFSYQALPPDAINRVIGGIGNEEAIGLFVDKPPDLDAEDPFAPIFFSVMQLAGELAKRYPEVANRALEDVYRGYESNEFNDEQVFASVLMDLAKDPLSGYPVLVFSW